MTVKAPLFAKILVISAVALFALQFVGETFAPRTTSHFYDGVGNIMRAIAGLILGPGLLALCAGGTYQALKSLPRKREDLILLPICTGFALFMTWVFFFR